MALHKGMRVIYRGREYAVTGVRWQSEHTQLVQLMGSKWVRASDVEELER